MTLPDRILTVVLYLALYGYLGYKAAWFHGVCAAIPAAHRVVGL